MTDDGKVHKGVLPRQSAAEVVLVGPEKPALISLPQTPSRRGKGRIRKYIQVSVSNSIVSLEVSYES